MTVAGWHGLSYHVRVRFREFVDLHKAMKRSGVSAKQLPQLPPKTLPFLKTTSEEFQANRRALLGAYATELLQRTCLLPRRSRRREGWAPLTRILDTVLCCVSC